MALRGEMGTPDEVYDWLAVQVGDQSLSYTYVVTHEAISDYCRAVGYENPIYGNDQAAREVGFPGAFAPATMLYTYAPQRRQELMMAKGYLAPEQSPDAPKSTPFVATRINFQGVLVRPGDVIMSTTRVSEKSERRGRRFVTFRVTAHNQRRELVGEYDYTCLWDTLGTGT